jgi:hypothetical protein
MGTGLTLPSSRHASSSPTTTCLGDSCDPQGRSVFKNLSKFLLYSPGQHWRAGRPPHRPRVPR